MDLIAYPVTPAGNRPRRTIGPVVIGKSVSHVPIRCYDQLEGVLQLFGIVTDHEIRYVDPRRDKCVVAREFRIIDSCSDVCHIGWIE